MKYTKQNNPKLCGIAFAGWGSGLYLVCLVYANMYEFSIIKMLWCEFKDHPNIENKSCKLCNKLSHGWTIKGAIYGLAKPETYANIC